MTRFDNSPDLGFTLAPPLESHWASVFLIYETGTMRLLLEG